MSPRGAPLGLRLAVRLLPRRVREEVLGDLVEAWNARSQYEAKLSLLMWTWRQPLAALASRLRATSAPNARGSLLLGLGTDLRLAVRSLAKVPMFTATVVTTLAVAVGSNTAIFSVVDAVLLDPLGFPAADRLVSIAGSAPGTEMPAEFPLGAEFFVQYRERADLLEDIGMFMAGEGTMRAEGYVEQIFMVQGLPSLFTTLGVTPVLGRLPRTDEQMGMVALISHSMWTSWFGADPDIVGKAYDIVGRSCTIVGVMGPEFRFPDERTSVWIHGTIPDVEDIRPGTYRFELVGRMAEGVNHEALATQLNELAARLPERVGGSPQFSRVIENHRAVVRSLEEELVGDSSGPLRLLFGTVAVVLLIACANVMNLLLVRGESRRKELAVRGALGAGRWRLVRLQLSEAVVLASLGGALGCLIAWAGLPALLRAAPDNVLNLSAARLDARALFYALFLASFAACTFGVLPAIRSARPAGAAVYARLASRQRNGYTRSALVTLQTAAALVLLVASGLLMRSYWTLTRVDPGYETDDLLTFQVATGPDDPRERASYVPFHRALTQRLEALPGVESVGVTAFLPLDEGAGSLRVLTESMRQRDESPFRTRYTRVAGDYFETMGIELERGRLLEPRDREDLAGVLVSRFTADVLWPGDEAVGKRIVTFPDTTNWKTVVGVVEDILVDDLKQTEDEAMMYLPIVGASGDGWTYDSPVYVMKAQNAASLFTVVRDLVREMAPEAPMYRISTMNEFAERSMAALSFTMLLIGMASGLALLLGVVGLYGVLSFVVGQRAQEIALRMAIGAEAGRVRRMVVVHGARLTLTGVVLGLIAATGMTRLLDSLLFGVGALDLPTFAVMTVVMLTVALLASYIPAARASRLDPMRLLRLE